MKCWLKLILPLLAGSAFGYAPEPGLDITIIAQNVYGLCVTNTLNSYLPSTNNLQWDSNGNLTNDGTRSFAYSPENQLTSVTVAGAWKTDFVYDGLGRRRIERDYGWQGGQWQQTNELRFIYDGYLLMQVRDASNNVLWTLTRGLDLGGSLQEMGGIGGLLALTQPSTNNSQHFFYHADGAGNVTGLMDGNQSMAARYIYAAFGGLIRKSGPLADLNPLMFSSKMHLPHAEDIYDYGFRQYGSGLSRWLTQDPLGVAGGVNLYGFVHNNPLIYADPLGLQGYIGWGPPPAPPNPITSAMMEANLQSALSGQTILPPAVAAQIQGDWAQLAYGMGGLVYDFTPFGNVWESATGTDFDGSRLTTDERNAAMQLAGIDALTLLAPEAKVGKVPCPKATKGTRPFFRVVSEPEYKSLMESGKFSAPPGGGLTPIPGQPGKWFWGSQAEAEKFGPYWYGSEPYRIIRSEIPSSIAPSVAQPGVDNIGTGFFFELQDLQGAAVNTVR